MTQANAEGMLAQHANIVLGVHTETHTVSRGALPEDIGGVMMHGVLKEHNAMLNQVPEEELLDEPEQDIVPEAFLQVAERLQAYIGQLEQGAHTLMRSHQVGIFKDVAAFVSEPPFEDNKPITRGHVKAPTGVGKTVIFSSLAAVLSSRPNAAENLKAGALAQQPLRGLVLVPKLDLVQQTLGKEYTAEGMTAGGFKQFAPNVNVTEFHGLKKDLAGDVVVMTYQSLITAMRKKIITPDMFDYLIADEAHRALGKKTEDAILKLTDGERKIPGFGFTATTKFKEKEVKDLFTEPISTVELRDAIELGWLSPVRAYGVATDIELGDIIAGTDFTEQELRQLISHEWRNRSAVDFAKTFAEQGQAGVVSCVPGKGVEHAHILAALINQTYMKDPKTGQQRRMRAVAMHGDMPPLLRQKVYESYEKGDIDVLTYVDILTEGWDSTRAQYLINLRPTSSPVNAEQRMGRVLRPAEGKIATIIEYIDKTKREVYTFWHAMGHEVIKQGDVIGSDWLYKNEPQQTGATTEANERISASLSIEERGINLELTKVQKELLARIENVKIDELVVQHLPDAQEGDIRLHELLQRFRIGRETFYKLLARSGLEVGPQQMRFNGVRVAGIRAQDLAATLQLIHENMPRNKDEVILLKDLGKEYGIHQGKVRLLMLQNEMPFKRGALRSNVVRRGGGYTVADYFEPADQERARAICEAYVARRQEKIDSYGESRKFTNKDVQVKDLKIMLGVGDAKFNQFFDSLETKPTMHTDQERQNMRFFTKKDADKLFLQFVKQNGYNDAMLADIHEVFRVINKRAPKRFTVVELEKIAQQALEDKTLKKMIVARKEGGREKVRLARYFLEDFYKHVAL